MDGVGETLVRDVEEEDIEPGPEDDVGGSGEYAEEVGGFVGGHYGAGEGAEEAEGAFRDDEGFEVAEGEE